MSVDDAAKLVMSAGVIQPDETQRRLQTLAEAAKAAETNRRDERVLEPTEG
jgi:uncharacterized membrane protein